MAHTVLQVFFQAQLFNGFSSNPNRSLIDTMNAARPFIPEEALNSPAAIVGRNLLAAQRAMRNNTLIRIVNPKIRQRQANLKNRKGHSTTTKTHNAGAHQSVVVPVPKPIK